MVGSRISHYRVAEKLGGGGMGVVYRAEDTKLLRTVALKFLPVEWSRDEHAKRRFLREARLASALDHPNICTIHEVGETEEGQLFIAMSCYDGETLKARVARGPVEPAAAIKYGIQIARGLSKAHADGIIHRDIKPANVMVTSDDVVKILDFGLARPGASDLTRTDASMGTAAYMSPEQARGETLDQRTDLWSLGVVLYELVTGKRPFKAEFEPATLYAVINEDPPLASERNPDVSAELSAVIHKCLAKPVDDRYQSTAELLEDLTQIERGETSELSASQSRGRNKRSSGGPLTRLPRPALLAIATLVLLVAAFTVPQIRGLVFPPASSEAAGAMRLAVLPFNNIGAEQDFVDGLVYAITSNLTTLEQFEGALSVVPPQDVYSRDVTDSRTARRQFSASHVVQGSVRSSGDGFVLTVDLVDTRSGDLVESTDLNLRTESVADLKDEVVPALALLLHIEITPQTQDALLAGQTTVPAAYDHFSRAHGYHQRFDDESNIDAALSLYSLAIKEDSSYALAYAGRADAYLRKFDATRDSRFITLASEAGERAVDLGEDLAATQVALGRTYYVRGDQSKAELHYLRALQAEPNNAEAHNLLGKVYYEQGRIEKAEESLNAAIDIKPDYWFYHNELGQFYHRLGRHQDAIEPFQNVIRLDPDQPWGYNNLGTQYYELGDYDRAMPQYEMATKVNPNSSRPVGMALRNLGNYAVLQDDFEKAISLYERAVEREPNNLDGCSYLANARFWSGDRDGATESWERCLTLAREQIKVNASDPWVLGVLASTHAALGKPDSARIAIDRLLQLEQLDGSQQLELATTFEILGDRKSALHYVAAALRSGRQLMDVEASPWFDELRKDPGYAGNEQSGADPAPPA